VLVIVKADAGEGPQNESHHCKGDSLGHGSMKPAEVVMDDENTNKLDDKIKMTESRDRGIVNLPLWDLRAQVIIPQATKTWEPARSFEPDSDLVQPVSACRNLVLDALEVEQLVFDNIEKLWLVNKTVHCFLVRTKVLKCSKHSVPN